MATVLQAMLKRMRDLSLSMKLGFSFAMLCLPLALPIGTLTLQSNGLIDRGGKELLGASR